jgi:hypothetical protein
MALVPDWPPSTPKNNRMSKSDYTNLNAPRS